MGVGNFTESAPNSKADLREFERVLSNEQIFLICEICFEKIAVVETSRLHRPVDGTMFLSSDPQHGVPDPWDPSLTWEFIRCPHCRMRPFVDESSITTTKGKMSVPEAIEEPVEPPPVSTLAGKPRITTKPQKYAKDHKKPEGSFVFCDFCGKGFDRKQQLVGHMMHCKNRPDGRITIKPSGMHEMDL